LHLAAASSPAPPVIQVGILTEATGEHLSGYLAGFAVAEGIALVSTTDVSEGAQFEAVRSALPARRVGSMHTSVGEMLGEREPALTLVTAEAHRTPELIRAALEAGSHVLVEKPGCLHMSEFEAVCDLAEAKGLHVMLAMANRFNPALIRAKELIDAGFLGRPYSATMDLVADATRLEPDILGEQLLWKYRHGQTAGGKLAYHGIHYIDLLQWLLGDRIGGVAALTANVVSDRIENEDATVLSFRMAGSGLVGTLNAGYYAVDGGPANQIRLWGSRGWLHWQLGLGGGEWPLRWQSNHRDAPAGEQSWEWEFPDGYKELTVAAVRFARGLGPPPITTADSRAAMRVVFAAYTAAESGSTQLVARE
jgi:predicted dehydrogenase